MCNHSDSLVPLPITPAVGASFESPVATPTAPLTPQEFAHSANPMDRRLFLKAMAGAGLAAAGAAILAPISSQAQARPGPNSLEFNAEPIVFRSGVPVGGRSHITLYPDGHYHFTGHFHVSGAPSYNAGIAWMIRAASGQTFLFTKRGHLHGTFESGSRNYNWDVAGTNEDIRRSWAQLASNRSGWKAEVNMDLEGIIAQVKKAVEAAGQIVRVVQVVTS